MADINVDCVVVGAGPGGYVAAIRLAQLGVKTAVVEKDSPGGVCLNWGCIPSKALLKSAELFNHMKHAKDFGLIAEGVSADFPGVMLRSRVVVDKMTKGVSFLMKKNKIEYLTGHATFTGPNELKLDNGKTVGFKNAMIATGARARSLPNLPVDHERVLTYRSALALKECPKKLLVIGAGAIGAELGYFFKSFGAEVTIVELLDNLLPIEDQDVSKQLEKSFQKQGIEIRTKSSVESLERKGETVSALIKSESKVEQWIGDYCLVAIGFLGNSDDLGLETIGVKVEKSWIPVDEFYRTNVPHIYAIGDINGPPWLAHVASHEGIIAAEHVGGAHPHPMNYDLVPGCTYCQPQVASIGLTEKKAREKGLDIKIGRFPFSASGKAVASNETEGFVKVIIDAKLEELLGVHIIHAEATELIAEVTVAKAHEGIASSVFNTIHAHPTLSEAVMEAMGDALGRAIHI